MILVGKAEPTGYVVGQPDVSRTRLYLEAMEGALGRAKLFVVDPGDGGAPLTLRLIAP